MKNVFEKLQTMLASTGTASLSIVPGKYTTNVYRLEYINTENTTLGFKIPMSIVLTYTEFTKTWVGSLSVFGTTFTNSDPKIMIHDGMGSIQNRIAAYADFDLTIGPLIERYQSDLELLMYKLKVATTAIGHVTRVNDLTYTWTHNNIQNMAITFSKSTITLDYGEVPQLYFNLVGDYVLTSKEFGESIKDVLKVLTHYRNILAAISKNV